MRKRKTVDVKWLKDSINKSLERSTCTAETRYGMISALEWVLHETNNYEGYYFLHLKEDPNFDDSRRFYY